MNALVRTQNGFYCSTVFAFYNNHYNSTVIVFNENNSKLVVVNCDNIDMHSCIHRVVFFADSSKDNWVENEKWQGLDFLVNNKDLLKCIEKGDDVALDILNKCNALQTTETFNGWNSLDTETDIEKLMNISIDFHDGYIESVDVVDNDSYVKFKCWSCHITMKFTNLSESEICERIPWGFTSIANAVMCFEKEKIKWYVDGFNCCEGDDPDSQCYFIAECAQYKVELD